MQKKKRNRRINANTKSDLLLRWSRHKYSICDHLPIREAGRIEQPTKLFSDPCFCLFPRNTFGPEHTKPIPSNRQRSDISLIYIHFVNLKRQTYMGLVELSPTAVSRPAGPSAGVAIRTRVVANPSDIFDHLSAPAGSGRVGTRKDVSFWPSPCDIQLNATLLPGADVDLLVARGLCGHIDLHAIDNHGNATIIDSGPNAAAILCLAIAAPAALRPALLTVTVTLEPSDFSQRIRSQGCKSRSACGLVLLYLALLVFKILGCMLE